MIANRKLQEAETAERREVVKILIGFTDTVTPTHRGTDADIRLSG